MPQNSFGEAEALERASLLTRAIKILLKAVPEERNGATERRLHRFKNDRNRERDSGYDPTSGTLDEQQQ